MHSLIALSSLLAAIPHLAAAQSTASAKRGLVYVPSTKHPSDDNIWIRAGSDLSWYYNYVDTPSDSFKNDDQLEFVPMLFSAPNDPNSTDTSFLDSIVSQIKSGVKITHVLTYNEPDGGSDTGGTNLPVDTAASTWMRNIKPLRDNYGIKVGLPAVTGSPNGMNWLANFNTSCLALDSAGCKADFIPLHWYGNFEGLASHVGDVRAHYPTIGGLWVTEFNLADESLKNTEEFYNETIPFLDRVNYVDRYSMFAAFRSDVSNVGPNAAFLTQSGKLTDIGSWYLGGTATGNKPKGAAGRVELSTVLMCLGTVVAALASCY